MVGWHRLAVWDTGFSQSNWGLGLLVRAVGGERLCSLLNKATAKPKKHLDTRRDIPSALGATALEGRGFPRFVLFNPQ